MGAVVNIKKDSDDKTKAQRWIDAYCRHGDATRAVHEAGYNCTTKESASAMGSRNKVRYQQQILSRARSIVAANAPAAINSLVELAASSDQDSVRVTACKALATMAGLDIPEPEQEKRDERTDDELIEAIGNLINSNSKIKQALSKYIAK